MVRLEIFMITEHNDILFSWGRLTNFVFFASQRLAKGHTRASDLEPHLHRKRAKSTNSAYKRTKDYAFGSYIKIEHNDKYSLLGVVSQTLSFLPRKGSQKGTLVHLTWNLSSTETELNPPIWFINA